MIFVVFAICAFMLWNGWETQQAKLHPPKTVATQPDNSVPSAPSSTSAQGAANQSTPTATAPTAAELKTPKVEPITITTDLYKLEISPVGGVLQRMALLKQMDANDKTKPYLALNDDDKRRFLVAQTGFTGGVLPNHYTLYKPASEQRELKDGENQFTLALDATAPNGDKVQQIYTFHRGTYLIDVTMKVTNEGKTAISPTAYFQFTRDTREESDTPAFAPKAYLGPALYDENDKFKKVTFKELDEQASGSSTKPLFQSANNNGWISMIEHYFVTAWALPDKNTVERHFYAKRINNSDKYVAGMTVPMGSVAPGATGELTVPLYAGPQDQDKLKKIASHLNYVVDYGIFTVLAAPMFWLIQFFYKWIGNWGWAIVAMTVLIRLVFFPLNAAAARSMAKMRIVGPKMKALQEEFKDDKQQLQMRLMALYKEEKINPLGGCLPILIQMPFFIALYWVLLSAAELRFAPWFGWIHDLSARDPYYILPILYAISAFFQMKLSPTPATADKMQTRIIQSLPIIFAVMFAFFPAGLVLYWWVSNLFQIGQQWYMNRVLEKAEKARR